MQRADLVDEQGRHSHKKIDVEDIIQGILDLKAKLGNIGLAVIGSSPQPEENLFQLLMRPKLPFVPNYSVDEFLFSPEEKRHSVFNEALFQAAKQTSQFVFIDPGDALCSEGSCTNFDSQKRLLYTDDGHYSIYGSQFVIGRLASKLKNLLW